MTETHIRQWQKILQIIDSSIKGDGIFGPKSLAASMKVAEKAGITDPKPPINPNKHTGKDFIALAKTRLGEEYVYGADVDLDDPDYHGVWDCAEYVSWVVKQITGNIYGCVDNNASNPDPYTGGWKKDALNGTVIKVSVEKAANTEGGILLRFREGGKHIVFSQGNGKTVEAKSAAYGVCEGKVGNLSSWDIGILIPDVEYS